MPKKKETIIKKVEDTAKKITKELVKDIEVAEEKIEEFIKGEEKTKKKPAKKRVKKPAKKEKFTELLEKAKKLEAGVEEAKEVDIKKKIKEKESEKEDTLVPMEDYLKSSIHLGTKVITPDMKSYVYRRRADGLAVFNTALLDDKIREGAEYLAKFAPKDVVVICKSSGVLLYIPIGSSLISVILPVLVKPPIVSSPSIKLFPFILLPLFLKE